MKKIFFLPLLVISLSIFSQTNDPAPPNPFNKDSVDAKIEQWKDDLEKTRRDIQWQNNTRGLEDVMRVMEKNRKKQKTKAILYIVIGVGLALVLVIRFFRRSAEKKVN